MKCKQLKKIENYYRGGLTDLELAFIQEHLETCDVCSGYLNELKYHDQFLSRVKNIRPELQDPVTFRNEILSNIKPVKKWSARQEFIKVIDTIIFILLHPAARYSFITAALLIFGIFIYQQTIIVQKIGSLEKRIEVNTKNHDSQSSNRMNIEAFLKKQDVEKISNQEFDDLLNNYRLLQIKYKVLIKLLKEKHPETYREFFKEEDVENNLSANTEI